MAISATSLTAEVAQILGNLGQSERFVLNRSAGYAFEAWVMTVLGAHLAHHGWRWVHPSTGPAFAKGNGGTVTHRLKHCSFLVAANYGCPVLVQGISVEGASGVMHDVDLALWCGHQEAPEALGLGVTAVVEAKNHTSAQSLSCARNLLGLRLDLAGPHHTHGLETILISTGTVTTNAEQVMAHWGIRHQQRVTTANPNWAAEVIRYLRYARGCSWGW